VAQALAVDGAAFLKRVDENLYPQSYEMYRKIIDIQPDGSKREFTLYSIRKGADKIVSLFLAPASDKGRVTLRQGDNMWLYIPSVGKPVRITSLQSVTGGIFNNSDIMALDYSVEYTCESLQEQGDLYVLKLKAKTGAVAYDRLVMEADKKRALPTKIECYAASGMLIKTLYFKDVKEFGSGFFRPSVIETDSPLHKGYKSYMVFAKIQKRAFPDEVFTLNYLPNVESLRK
jgi:hypothetical protein